MVPRSQSPLLVGWRKSHNRSKRTITPLLPIVIGLSFRSQHANNNGYPSLPPTPLGCAPPAPPPSSICKHQPAQLLSFRHIAPAPPPPRHLLALCHKVPPQMWWTAPSQSFVFWYCVNVKPVTGGKGVDTTGCNCKS